MQVLKAAVLFFFLISNVNVYQENEVEADDNGESAAAAASGERRPVSTIHMGSVSLSGGCAWVGSACSSSSTFHPQEGRQCESVQDMLTVTVLLVDISCRIEFHHVAFLCTFTQVQFERQL